MKVQWHVREELHVFLNSALRGSEWSGSRSDQFQPCKNSDTYWIGRYVSCTDSRERFENRICPPHSTANGPSMLCPAASDNWTVADPPTGQAPVQLAKCLKGWSNNLIRDKGIRSFPQNVKTVSVGGSVNGLDASVASTNKFPIAWPLPDLLPPPNYEWGGRRMC
jgi:hypothetical protein